MGEREADASPCIGICSTGIGDEICRGCGRTFEEVNNWHSYSKAEKIAINRRIQKEEETERSNRALLRP